MNPVNLTMPLAWRGNLGSARGDVDKVADRPHSTVHAEGTISFVSNEPHKADSAAAVVRTNRSGLDAGTPVE